MIKNNKWIQTCLNYLFLGFVGCRADSRIDLWLALFWVPRKMRTEIHVEVFPWHLPKMVQSGLFYRKRKSKKPEEKKEERKSHRPPSAFGAETRYVSSNVKPGMASKFRCSRLQWFWDNPQICVRPMRFKQHRHITSSFWSVESLPWHGHSNSARSKGCQSKSF